MPPPIPDRWIPYSACGKVIEGTRIICFKVPLRKSVQVGKVKINEIWDIKALLEKIPNLGAVIDLTNTSRYYDPRELQSAREGILYQKILMPGRIIPPENKVQSFMDTVDEFLGKDCVAVQVKKARLGLPTAESLIGVHCTHGLNRTGYMVCRYMRDRLNIPAQTAIKRFEKARGYQIERANYIADLLGEEPPPADTGRFTNVKPISDRDRDRRSSSRNQDEGGTASRRRRKYSYKTNERNSESKDESTNWRTEGRDIRRHAWNNDESGEKSQSRRSRTDSERSYDFRSKSSEEMNGQQLEDDRKRRRQEKKNRKKKEKLEKEEEDRKLVRKEKKKLRNIKKKNKVTEMARKES